MRGTGYDADDAQAADAVDNVRLLAALDVPDPKAAIIALLLDG